MTGALMPNRPLDDDEEIEGLDVPVKEDEEPDTTYEEAADGGLLVKSKKEKRVDLDFYENLAKKIDPHDRKRIAMDFLELIDRDKDARKKRDDKYAEGIRRTGLGDEAPGGANFPGASRAVHPVMAESCVDFAASAMRELFPPSGPVKTRIVGTQTVEKYNKAVRKAQHMNWQLTEEMPEYPAELEQLLTQLPLGGSQYLKLYRNHKLKRNQAEFLPIDDVFLPFSATYFYTAERITHRQLITELEFNTRVKEGIYLDIDDGPPPSLPNPTSSQRATDVIEGKESTEPYNTDGQREIFETSAYYDLPEGVDEVADDNAPYIFIFDEYRADMVGCYRNWEEDDERQARMEWIVEFAFIPWRGAYAVGLPHLIGGLSIAATGALRALLDSAFLNTVPGGMKMSTRVPGQNANPQPGEWTPIQGPPNIDDIRKLYMPSVMNPPSPVLLEMLGIVVAAAKGVVSTAEEKISEARNDMPVGTALALIEQGAKVFSAIHARLHRSQKMVLKILHRLNRMYLSERQVIEELGELIVSNEDYRGPMDVIPVSDPNIFSETQRYAQMQAVAQRSALMPQLYKLPSVEQRLLEVMKIPEPQELLVETHEAEETDAVRENVKMALGRPVEVYEHQDHVAHLMVHLAFLADPHFGGSPLIAPVLVMAAVTHLREHLAYFYQTSMLNTAFKAAGVEIDEIEDHMSEDVKKSIDELLAVTAGIIHNEERFAIPRPIVELPAELQKVIQAAQAAMAIIGPLMAAAGPQDPAAEAAKAETARRTADDQAKAQLKTQELALDKEELGIKAQGAQLKAQESQAKVSLDQAKIASEQSKEQRAAMTDQARLALEERRAKLEEDRATLESMRIEQDRELAELDAELTKSISNDELDVKLKTNSDDNMTAMTIAQAEIKAGGKSALKTGTGINP